MVKDALKISQLTFNGNTRKKCERCSKLTIEIPERPVVIVNFEHVSHLFLVFLLLNLNK